jgi:hypothetical protein
MAGKHAGRAAPSNLKKSKRMSSNRASLPRFRTRNRRKPVSSSAESHVERNPPTSQACRPDDNQNAGENISGVEGVANQ